MITSASALRLVHRISTEFDIEFDAAATMVGTMSRDLKADRTTIDPAALDLEIVHGRMIASLDGVPRASASLPRH